MDGFICVYVYMCEYKTSLCVPIYTNTHIYPPPTLLPTPPQYTKFHGVSLTLLRKFAKQILKALAFLAHKDVRRE